MSGFFASPPASSRASNTVDHELRQPHSNASMLECRLCSDVFSLDGAGARIPRLLLCGHTLCQQCLTKLTVQDNSIHCPFDRQATPIGDSGVWCLKKNFALLELLEKLELSERMHQSTTGDVLVGTSPSIASASTGLVVGAHFDPVKERQLNILCDENEQHLAVVYCTVCESHLCLDCSSDTHCTRVLMRHARVPLSQKPQQRLRCSNHTAYALEFVCLEENCNAETPLMCILCRDYGRHTKHAHALLESEAANLRTFAREAMECFNGFSDQVLGMSLRVDGVIRQIESSSSDDIIDPDSFSSSGNVDDVPGSAARARQEVRMHFAVLREVLHAQEVAALTVVDVYVRERLGVLQHQAEEMNALITQICSTCSQLERISSQDDVKVILARRELHSCIENVRKRQEQFSDLPQQLNLETKIPISFTKDNRVHIGPKIEMRVVAIGLDNSGKSSILFRLRHNEIMATQPTIGFNVEAVEYKNLRMTIWDVGGHPKLRPLWKHYYSNTQALVFVVDSCDRNRFAEVQSELVKLLSESDLRDASLLIFANKQDVEGAASVEELIDLLTLSKLCYGRSWHLQPCDAVTGRGLLDGVEWLARQLVSASLTTQTVDTANLDD